MTVKEIKVLVDRIAHEASNREYFKSHCMRDAEFRADYAVDSLTIMAEELNANIVVVRSNNCHYSAVIAPYGKNKLYCRWVTSCDIDVDHETFEEYNKVVTEYINNGFICYTTDGNNGAMLIER